MSFPPPNLPLEKKNSPCRMPIVAPPGGTNNRKIVETGIFSNANYKALSRCGLAIKNNSSLRGLEPRGHFKLDYPTDSRRFGPNPKCPTKIPILERALGKMISPNQDAVLPNSKGVFHSFPTGRAMSTPGFGFQIQRASVTAFHS